MSHVFVPTHESHAAGRLAKLEGVLDLGPTGRREGRWLGLQVTSTFVPVVWPAGFCITSDSQGLNDSKGSLVALLGQRVVIVGGYLPADEAVGRFSESRVFVCSRTTEDWR